MLWIESNSKYIYMILDMFNTIQQYKENLFDIITRIIDNREINLEVSERSPECKKEVNLALYLVYESCLKSILDDFEFLNDLNEVQYFDFLKTIKSIMQNAMQLEINLRFFSKEIFHLQSFLQIIYIFTQEGEKKKDKITELINLMKRESEIFANENFTDDENIKQLIENLDKEYKFLKEEIKDNELQSKLIMYILDGKIKQIPNKEYRKKLLEYILNDNNLILKSGKFLAIILNKEIAPSSQTDDEENIEDLIEDYLSFAKEHDPLYEILENQKKIKYY